jgi:hypothetical protein
MPVSRGLDAELADDPFRSVKRACLECGRPDRELAQRPAGIEGDQIS